MKISYLDHYNNERFFFESESKTLDPQKIKETLLSYCKDPIQNLEELKILLNNRVIKNYLKSRICAVEMGAFGSFWDGAMIIVNTLNLEDNPRAKSADLELLKEDLTRLTSYF